MSPLKRVREPTLFSVINRPYYLIWWIISVNNPKLMKMYEKMAAIVTDAIKLKATDCSLKKASFLLRTCTKCNLGIEENANHIIMQCPLYEEVRKEMFLEIKELGCKEIDDTFENANELFPVLLGKQPDNLNIEDKVNLYMVTGKHITKIYDSVTKR